MSKISLGTNIPSLTAQRRLGDSSAQLQNVFERLSSGQRINRASDDAAGLAIASSLNFSTRVYSKAINNINDGISALSIASGSLSSLSGIVQRQLELAEQAANGTFSRTQRLTMQSEANALANEFNRILDTSSFNGLSLFGGSNNIRLQLGYGDSSFIDVGVGSEVSRAIGTGTFSALSGATIAVSAQETASADLNGDGKLDLIAATNGGTAIIRYGNGDGTFGAVSTVTTGGARYVAVGDVDGDGRMDLIHGTANGFTVTRQTSSGFAAAVTYTGNAAFVNGRNGTLADVNNDGRLDLIQTYNGASQGTEVFLNNGDGTFYSSATYSATSANGTPSVGDINGDGRMDFIVSGNFGSGNGVYAFYGNGNGTFSGATNLGMAGGTNLSALADFNNDGILDVLQASGAGGLLLRLGNANGTFQATQTRTDIGGNILSTGMNVVDLNKDGFADVVGISYSTGALVTYLGNGDGSFRSSTSSYIGAINPLGLSLGDFNGDGVEDVATSTSGTTFVMSANTTQSAYMEQVYLATQEGARNSLESLRAIFQRIQEENSSIGASLSRLGFAMNAIVARREGELASYSRIMDADIGEETSQLTRLSILQNVGAAILSQANIQPNIAIKLLK